VIRIIVVAPSPVVRIGIRALLGDPITIGNAFATAMESKSGIEIVGEAQDLQTLNTDLQADILIITEDIASQVDLHGVAEDYKGELGLLLLSNEPIKSNILSDLNFRNWGLLPLEASAEQLQAAIHAVAAGLLVSLPTLVSSESSSFIFTEKQEDDNLVNSLTEREAEVLQLLADGLANKQIALQLGISEHTAKFHVSSIYSKLDVTIRAEAVRKGIQQGLVTL